MAKVIIFGIKDFAQLAKYYLETDTEHEVVGFSTHEKYIPDEKSFEGLPIIPFDNIEKKYPPDKYHFFAPMSSSKMNKLRAKVYHEIKQKGYHCISYISSRASLFNNKIGENCFILEDNTLQPFTDIGNNVVLWSGNHIGHHGQIKDHVFFTSHVVMSGHCVIEPYSFFGVNASIRDGAAIAEGSLIGMGAVITKNTEPWNIYLGAPAKPTGKKSDEIDF